MQNEENKLEEEILEKELPENKEPITHPIQKKHRLRNWILGLSALTALGFIGDYGLQNSVTEFSYTKGNQKELKLVTTYQPGQGCKNLGWAIKSESSDLWASTTKAIKLEEKITKTKETIRYNEHKTLYQVGAGAAAGALGAYFLMRRKKK